MTHGAVRRRPHARHSEVAALRARLRPAQRTSATEQHRHSRRDAHPRAPSGVSSGAVGPAGVRSTCARTITTFGHRHRRRRRRRLGGAARAARHGRRPRLRLTLVAPDAEFSYRPLAVAEPFSLGRARPRAALAVRGGDRCRSGAVDALVGGRRRGPPDPVASTAGRAPTMRCWSRLGDVPSPEWRARGTWFPGGDRGTTPDCCATSRRATRSAWRWSYRPGAVWPLPAYELALTTAGEAARDGTGPIWR